MFTSLDVMQGTSVLFTRLSNNVFDVLMVIIKECFKVGMMLTVHKIFCLQLCCPIKTGLSGGGVCYDLQCMLLDFNNNTVTCISL
jgi:hypothetical protein